MRISRRPLLIGALSFGLPIFGPTIGLAQSNDASRVFNGEWNGVLRAGNVSLRLHLAITEGPQALLVSVDQGFSQIPASSTNIEGTHITIEFAAINARFVGQLSAGRITGTFTQGQNFPLSFERGALPAAAATPPPVALTPDILRQLREQSEAPALTAGASRRDGGQIGLATGLRSFGGTAQVTTQDKWHLGSITKSMTATLVARCVEAGAVSWDDKVGTLLGQSVRNMRDEYKDVTFRHLLSHRSGLPGDIPLEQFGRFSRQSTDARAERIAVANIALNMAPLGAKEATFSYANNGYIIAGAMLEAKLGASWEHLITERLFTPLNMTSAGFGAPEGDAPFGHALTPHGLHTPMPPTGAVSDNPVFLGPAGRVHANMADVLTYLSAHRDQSDLLQAASWEILHTPPFGGNYAMGWIAEGDRLWHNGSNTLWYGEVAIDKGHGIVAMAAANDGNLGKVQPAVSAALRAAGLAVRQ